MDPEQFMKASQTRKKTWAVVHQAISSLVVDDLEKHGQMSPSKHKKLIGGLEVLRRQDDTTAQRRLDAIKEIRQCFRDRTDLDHFLWVSGLTGGQQPDKRSIRITAAVVNALNK